MAGKAKFVFWWEGAVEDGQPVPFFNVVENDRGLENGSTVDGDSLLKDYGIPVPLFPDFKTWKREVSLKRRCFRCWAVVRGHRDLLRHRQMVHHETLFTHADSVCV